MFRLRKVFCLFLCLFLSAFPAFVTASAQDGFTIDIDALDMNSVGDASYIAQHLTAPTQEIRVQKAISDSNELAARVRLTIEQTETSTVIFDKNYGYVSGEFDSGYLYLPYVDNNVIPYLVTLTIEDWTYAVPFMQSQPRLQNNGGCTYGLRMRDYGLSNSWVMGTMLDLDTLRNQGGTSIPLCASNLYIVGQAAVSVSGDSLSVSLSFTPAADVSISSLNVYLIGNVSALSTVDSSAIGQPAYGEGQSISIAGMSTALLYLPFTLSYNPTGLPETADIDTSSLLGNQQALWSANLQASN